MNHENRNNVLIVFAVVLLSFYRLFLFLVEVDSAELSLPYSMSTSDGLDDAPPMSTTAH